MRNVILSMPRCGSAWLAAYFGYLHDPHTIPKVGAGIVDTGAAADPDRAWRRHRGETTIVLSGDLDRVLQSLWVHDVPVSPELGAAWKDRLERVALFNNLPLFFYEHLFTEKDWNEIERLHDVLDEDFDPIRWVNQMECNVQHQMSYYTAERFESYMRWLRAS